MKVAVEGCCHGELDTIYSQIKSLENEHKYKVDLLLICGDFQAIRNHQDLQCMAVPDKYKQLGGFYKYYTGMKKAPVLTIVIGGNHEASNYMWELYHGGWLAPNIYYLGEAGCVRVNGVRIAGASGIFKSHDFPRGASRRRVASRSTCLNRAQVTLKRCPSIAAWSAASITSASMPSANSPSYVNSSAHHRC
jgi:lariat debranching enzyme